MDKRLKKVTPHLVTKELLKEITNKIVHTFNPDKIILFGSHAHGKPHEYSDVDLFIIMKTNERPSKMRIKISQLFWDREVAMDFIVKTPSEVTERLSMGDFFIRKVLEKGRLLYEKK